MIETVETVKDVEKQLAEARAKLQAFEDGVDSKRLIKRLRTASPAHPILVFRFLFLALTVVLVGGAVAVLAIPFFNADLARRLAKFDALVPVPPDIPGLPALIGLLALCMGVGYLMTHLAALAMGRDAQMLPWEQKQHQKLVNEVTRLTTQKAVMERMKTTPAGARPRSGTPVPVSLRDREGIATPSALSRLKDSQAGGPPRIGQVRPGIGGTSNPFGRAPGSATPAPSRTAGGSGGALFGNVPGGTPPGASAPAGGGGYSAPAGGGMLARARSGALKTTPAGAAGRLSPGFNGGGPGAEEEGGDDGGPFGGSRGPAAAPPSSNPFVSKSPAAERTAAPVSPTDHGAGSSPFGGASSPFGGAAPAPPSSSPFGGAGANPFGTPPGAPAAASTGGSPFGGGGPSGDLLSRASNSDNEDGLPSIVDNSAPYSSEAGAADLPEDDGQVTEFHRKVKLPKWGAIDDPWLEEAIEKVEHLAQDLPIQAHLAYSEETYLPFTLVLARATPTAAVKSLVAYVEFLASIPTPPRARIELSSSPGLDRSFHRNVEAALQPVYGDGFEVDIEPGRVEVSFTDPDAAWQDHPVLPIE